MQKSTLPFFLDSMVGLHGLLQFTTNSKYSSAINTLCKDGSSVTEIPDRMSAIKQTIISHNQRNFTKKLQLLHRYTLCQLFWWRHITKEPGIHISCSTCDSEQHYCNTYSCDSSNCPCYLRLLCNDTNSWEKSESKVVTFITKQKEISCVNMNCLLFF